MGVSGSGKSAVASEVAHQLHAAFLDGDCNPGSPIAQVADIAISPVVGPEALTGSTRLRHLPFA
jgi:N-acetylmuramic acid 6-phosphate etherase